MNGILEFLANVSERFWEFVASYTEQLPSFGDVNKAVMPTLNSMSEGTWLMVLTVGALLGFLCMKGMGSRKNM